MQTEKKNQPTESELEILQVLWSKESATVREIHEVLEASRDIGYTTTLKTMQIMTEKGFLERDTSSRVHIYTPVISQEKTREQFLTKMIDGLYNGSAGRLVLGALGSEKLSTEELQEIRNYLEQFE